MHPHRKAGRRLEGPPFGEYRKLVCDRCDTVEREWWRPAGDTPFEPIDAEHHRRPIPAACPSCGSHLVERNTLVDPASDTEEAR